MGGDLFILARRTGVAAIFALLLAVRLLTPGGFMPQFDRGQVAIVACDEAASVGQHEHGQGKPRHSQPCPYGAASALTVVDQPTPTLVVPPIQSSGAATASSDQETRQERHAPRPPSRAPPPLI
jgi:hypothetical protein